VVFGALPPEINSGLMYAGAGSGSLVAAAAAWEGLASQLGSAAASYRAVVSELTGGAWVGPSSVSMAAAAAPYVAWMNTTAARAEETANQLGAAIAAYEAAFAATVPPPLIDANRAWLAALVATNILGQNTPAIAATEAQYAQMWAQDAAAMYGYAGASAAATTLSPFNPPPQTTNASGTGAQAAAVTQAAASPAGATPNMFSQAASMLQSPASTSAADAVLGPAMSLVNSPGGKALNKLTGTYSEFISLAFQTEFLAAGVTNPMTTLMMPMPAAHAAAAAAAPALAAPKAALGALAGSLGGGGGVSAGLGRAATVGALSVPQSWGTASPAIRLAATALPAAGLDALPDVGPAGLMGGLVNASRNGAGGPRPESRVKVLAHMPGESGGNEGTPDRGMTPTGRAADPGDALSERERYELHTLREEIAELAIERDAVDRLIQEAMRR
jgi:PPE-repeat protein